jgi:hypothetical protein
LRRLLRFLRAHLHGGEIANVALRVRIVARVANARFILPAAHGIPSRILQGVDYDRNHSFRAITSSSSHS